MTALALPANDPWYDEGEPPPQFQGWLPDEFDLAPDTPARRRLIRRLGYSDGYRIGYAAAKAEANWSGAAKLGTVIGLSICAWGFVLLIYSAGRTALWAMGGM